MCMVGDGNGLDVIAGGKDALIWYQNNNVESFTARTLLVSVDAHFRAVGAGDIDGDGDVDVVAATSNGSGGDDIVWFENLGNGNFSTTFNTIASGFGDVPQLEVVDLNGDGAAEVVAVSDSNDRVGLFENNGVGVFNFVSIEAFADSGVNPSSLAVADFNGDSVLDVAVGFQGRKYDFQEVAFNGSVPTTGTTRLTSGDDISVGVSLGFSFNYFGNNFTTAFISSNGLMAFTNSSVTTYTNSQIGSTVGPPNMIAPFWDDLALSPGSIQTTTIGSVGSRQFIVTWNSVEFLGASTSALTFQVILEEATNDIIFQYFTMTPGNAGTSRAQGSSATIGIENQTETDGIQYLVNEVKGALDGRAFRFGYDYGADSAGLGGDVRFYSGVVAGATAFVIDEDNSLTFSAVNNNAISVADLNDDLLNVTLSVTNGSLLLANSVGLFGLDADELDGRAVIDFFGQAVAVNAALDGLVYTPSGNFVADFIDELVVFVDDMRPVAVGLTDIDVIPITVTADDDLPVAVNDDFSVGESDNGGFLVGSLFVDNGNGVDAVEVDDILTNASQGGVPIVFGTPFVLGFGGTVTVFNDGAFEYVTPSLVSGQVVTDSFTYTITDSQGLVIGSSTAVVNITVTGDDGNALPVAVSDVNFIIENSVGDGVTDPTVVGNVLDNDFDREGDAIVIAGFSGVPTYGTFSLDVVTGDYTYTLDESDADTLALNAGESAIEVFRYFVTDALNSPVDNEGTVEITVVGQNDGPAINTAPVVGFVVKSTFDISNNTNGEIFDIYAADVNSVGGVDIVIGGESFVGWLNNSGGAFSVVTVRTDRDGTAVFAERMDGQLDTLDIVSVDSENPTSGTASNLRQHLDAFGSSTIVSDASQVAFRGLFPVNLDADGDIDFVFAERDTGDVLWYRNSGIGAYTEFAIDTDLVDVQGVFAADLVGDGDGLDVIAGGKDALIWYQNNNFEGFTARTLLVSVDAHFRAVGAGDIDGDGDVDVVAATSNGVGGDDVIWFENLGGGVFATTFSTVASNFGDVADLQVVDLNNDGAAEVVAVSDSGDVVARFNNNGSGIFNISTIEAFADSGVNPSSLTVADFDGDSVLDVAVGFQGQKYDFQEVAFDSSIPNANLAAALTGTVLTSVSDSRGSSTNVVIPFSFNYFGIAFTSVNVSTEGFLSFTQSSADGSSSFIGSSDGPASMIAPFWDNFDLAQDTDQFGSSVSEIRTEVVGSVGSRQFIVTWLNVDWADAWPANGDLTFQVILEEGSNDIIFQYVEMDDFGRPGRGTGTLATIGIENPGETDGIQYLFHENKGSLEGRAFRFRYDYGGDSEGLGGDVRLYGSALDVSAAGSLFVDDTDSITINSADSVLSVVDGNDDLLFVTLSVSSGVLILSDVESLNLDSGTLFGLDDAELSVDGSSFIDFHGRQADVQVVLDQLVYDYTGPGVLVGDTVVDTLTVLGWFGFRDA